jgi:hypothetical protein
MVVAQQHAAAVNVLNFVKAVVFEPVRLNAFYQPRYIALRPQQLAVGVVNQRHRGALHIQVFGDINIDGVVFPFRQHIEQIALAAQQAEGGFIETDAVAHQRDHAIGATAPAPRRPSPAESERVMTAAEYAAASLSFAVRTDSPGRARW